MEELRANTKIDATLQRKPREKLSSLYRYLRTAPDTAGDFDASLGTKRSAATLSMGVWNEARARVNFKVACKSATIENIVKVFAKGCNFISQFKLTSQTGGQDIAFMDECNVYTNVINPLLINQSEFLRLDENLGSNTSASVSDRGMLLCPNKVASAVNVSGTSGSHANEQNEPIGYRIDSDGTAAEITDDMLEPRVLITSYSITGTAATVNLDISLPFAWICPLSPVSCDQDVPHIVDTTLELYFNSYDKVGFQNPKADVNTLGNAAILSGYSISDLHIMVPVLAQDELATRLMDEARVSGFRRLVPRVRHIKYASSNTSFNSPNLKINSGDGQRLLAVIHAIQNPTDTGIGNYNFNNLVPVTKAIGAKITSFQTKLDSLNITNNRLVCANMDDWAQIRDYVNDSAISSAKVWNSARVYFDCWTSSKTSDWMYDFHHYVDGKDLTRQERNYAIEATTPNLSQTFHMWVVTQAEQFTSNTGFVTFN